MASLLTAGVRIVALGAVAALPMAVFGVVPYQPNGSQYAIIGSLPGDQTKPQVALGRSGGYLVWQDNVTDASGFGISARRLDANVSGDRNVFRVNESAEGDQENPQVVLLADGGAAFVWQGGAPGAQDIFVRFMSPDNTFQTGEVVVNSHTAGLQCDPVLSALADGSLVVAWSSHDQDGSMQGVYAQRLTAAGQRIGTEFNVSEGTLWNQRNPSIAPLADGKFVVVWVNETGSDVTGSFQVGIQGRLFNTEGPVGSEFQINAGTNVCASPTIAGMKSGGFMVAWAERGSPLNGESWDVFSRAFSNAGTPKNFGPRVNAEIYGDQYAPKLSGGGDECLLIWTSMGQDGYREGVYGRFLSENGVIYSDEFRVNANPISRQIHSTVTSDGGGQFVSVWASFVGGTGSFDLQAQRFQADARPVPEPSAPYVNALSSSELLISWPEQTGLDVQGYDLYIDGSLTGIRVTGNSHRLTALAPGSTHAVTLTYQLADGRVSPESPAAAGQTWGPDANADDLPDDWQQANWGKPVNWPPAQADSDGDGASNLQEFLAGTDPTNPNSVLSIRLERNGAQQFLNWNSTPGLFYQVEKSTNVGGEWTTIGQARFANGPTDSVPVEGPDGEAYYRVIRLR